MPKPAKISTVMSGMLRQIEASYPNSAHRIWEVWPDAVGPELATRSSPLEFRNGKLTVGVEGAAWLQQFVFLSPKIIKAVNEALGVELVKSLITRAAVIEPPKAEPPPPQLLRSGPLTEQEKDLLDESTRGVEDPELAEAIKRAREIAIRRIRRDPPTE